MSKLNYSISSNLYDVTDMRSLMINGMRESFIRKGDNFFIRREDVITKMGEAELISTINTILDEIRPNEPEKETHVSQLHMGPNIIEFSVAYKELRHNESASIISSGDILKIFVDLSRGSDMEDDDCSNSIDVEILICAIETVGIEPLCRQFFKLLKEEVERRARKKKTSLLKWMFSDGNSQSERNFQIKKEWEIDESFYPCIDGKLKDYYKSYMKSNAQILVMYGKPGNGKTSFIRDMVCEMGLNAFISYDLKVLTSDSTFVSYVTNKQFDAIVIEDADELLTSSRSEHNKVIAKILNVSDGLIKLPKKKLIFTTNLPSINDIDPAIIRPGRCFDAIEFRSLTREEAEKVMDKIGAKLEGNKKEFTLAELFAMKQVQSSDDPFMKKNIITKKMGFI